MALREGDRVTKDGKPGTITGFYDDFDDSFVDIELDDLGDRASRFTYVLLPDNGRRVLPHIDPATGDPR